MAVDHIVSLIIIGVNIVDIHDILFKIRSQRVIVNCEILDVIPPYPHLHPLLEASGHWLRLLRKLPPSTRRKAGLIKKREHSDQRAAVIPTQIALFTNQSCEAFSAVLSTLDRPL